MATISILANTVRPSVDCRADNTAFAEGTFSWQDPAHSWKAGPGEVMTVEKQTNKVHIEIAYHANIL
jgi:hypothetical protein